MDNNRRNRITEKLSRFLDLRDGWHFGEGHRPNLGTFSKAADILNMALELPCETIDVAPGIYGEIQVLVTSGPNEVELTIEDSGLSTLCVEVGGESYEWENMTFDLAQRAFKDHSERICSNGLGFSEENNTWRIKADSHLSPLRTVRMEEFPSSTNAVLYRSLDRYADTFEPTMRNTLESRPYSGASKEKCFRTPCNSNQMTQMGL